MRARIDCGRRLLDSTRRLRASKGGGQFAPLEYICQGSIASAQFLQVIRGIGRVRQRSAWSNFTGLHAPVLALGFIYAATVRSHQSVAQSALADTQSTKILVTHVPCMNEHITVWNFPALPVVGIADCRYSHRAPLTTSSQSQAHSVGINVAAFLKLRFCEPAFLTASSPKIKHMLKADP